MADRQPNELPIHEAHRLLKSRELSCRELTLKCLERLEQVEPRIKALITVCAEQALEQADAADGRIANGAIASLTGIPFIAKDLLCTRGIPTTCGSRMLDGFVPPHNATVIERLFAQGSVLIGKSNMDEFAMGSSTEHSSFYPSHNPWKLDCVPGGSSGGSAAGLAAGECLFALGTDTGGSIRQPASFCGVVGMKPTYGRVSRYGAVAFASSLDQIGPFARDIHDCALVLNAISGRCARDATSAPVNVPDYTTFLNRDVKGLRIGIPKEYSVEGLQPEVQCCVDDAIRILEKQGATVNRDISLPSTRYALAAYYIIAPSEASANLARFDGVKYGFSRQLATTEESVLATRGEGFGPEVKRRIMLGTHTLSSGYYDAYYLKALKVRHLIGEDFNRAFDQCDVLAVPTSPTVAFPIGSKMHDLLQMYLSDVLTIPANIAGIPALSMPCGFFDGLPIGLQLMADRFREDILIQVGHAYERATDWHQQRVAL